MPQSAYITKDSSLAMINVTREDEGTYICFSGRVTLAEHKVTVPGTMSHVALCVPY